MVKTENKTPMKRKSMANQVSAKKQKLENKSPKPVGPKNTNLTPNKSNQAAKGSNKKNNKKNNKTAPETGSPKKVTQFAGTGQLKGNKKQNKPKNGTTKSDASEGQKKKRRMFANLITETRSKAGTKDADLLKSLNEKITAIQSKPELTKTAKRKLALLQRLKIIVEEGNNKETKVVKPKTGKAKETTPKGGATPKKQTQKVEEAEDDDDDEEDESDEADTNAEVEEDGDDDDEEDGDDDDDEDGDDDDEEDGDDDDEEDGDDDEEDESPPVQGDFSPKNTTKSDQKSKDLNISDLKKNNLLQTGQKRYVLFVGNIAYDTTKQDLQNHFSKVGEIQSIRIPTDKQNNKPRGFAYVELKDENTYQKCLSMHHTQLKNRRINVLYTQGGKKKGTVKKNEIKEKNFKLHALRRQGKLAGSVKESRKRSFRRKKQRQEKTDS